MSEERAQYLLAMAAEVRATARDMRFPEARRQMSEMAEQFERLARHQDALEIDDELLVDGVLAGWMRRQALAR